jgi:hypothetical protein
MNLIEAKAVLAQYYSGAAVAQADIDKSINIIRNRPLRCVAIQRVLKNSALLLSALPVDPSVMQMCQNDLKSVVKGAWNLCLNTPGCLTLNAGKN